MVPLSSPETVHARPVAVHEPITAAELDAEPRTCAVYEVTLDASVAGACHSTAIVPSPRVAVTERGAVGLPPGVAEIRLDDVPSPAVFVAYTAM